MNQPSIFFLMFAPDVLPKAFSSAAGGGFASALAVSSLDLLHLITSLAYLLLLTGASGLRFVFFLRRKQPQPSLSDLWVILFGYVFPGLVGLLPMLVAGNFPTRSWNDTWTLFVSPEFLWIPATQALALLILAPQMASPVVEPHPAQRPISPVIALLAGFALWLVFTFLSQLVHTLVFPGLTLAPVRGTPFVAAILAAGILPFVSERVVRGRYLPFSLRKGRSLQKNILLQALLSGLLTFRPAAFVPATLGGYLYAWLSLREGRLRPAILAHLVFNLAALLFQAYIIH